MAIIIYWSKYVAALASRIPKDYASGSLLPKMIYDHVRNLKPPSRQIRCKSFFHINVSQLNNDSYLRIQLYYDCEFQFWNKHNLFVVNNIKFVAVSVRNTFIYLFLPFIAFTSTHTTKPHRFNEHYYGILCATWHQDTMQGLLWELCN